MPSFPDPPADFRGDLHVEERLRLPFADASGILRALPAAAAVPRDADDVAALVRWAAREGMPLVPRGAGTGMPGGNVGSGVAVDLRTHFRAAPAVDAGGRGAHVEPGTTRAELNAAAARTGCTFPWIPPAASGAPWAG
jgi:FAD/FMN-containing dehydrogenase